MRAAPRADKARTTFAVMIHRSLRDGAKSRNPRRYRWLVAAKIALIFAAVALSYLPALSAGFVWDDEPLITANPLLRNLSGLAEIWSGSRTADYFPLTNTLFWIEFPICSV